MTGGSHHHLNAGGGSGEYHRDLETAQTTTSNEIPPFVNGSSWVTPALIGGNYLLTVTANFQVSSPGRTLDAKVMEGALTLIDFVRLYAATSAEWHAVSITRQVTLAAGVHTLDFMFKKLNGGGTITVDEIEMILRGV